MNTWEEGRKADMDRPKAFSILQVHIFYTFSVIYY